MAARWGLVFAGAVLVAACAIEREMPTKDDGALVFAENCAVCHGADGQGRVGVNLSQDFPAIDLTAFIRQAVVGGVPSIAVSLDAREWSDFRAVTGVVVRLARAILAGGLPANTFLNVNAPPVPSNEVKGVLVTRLGQRVYRDVLVEREDPKGEPYYWIGGEPPTGVVEDGTDYGAVARGYISVTPLSMDMTDYQFMEKLGEWLGE